MFSSIRIIQFIGLSIVACMLYYVLVYVPYKDREDKSKTSDEILKEIDETKRPKSIQKALFGDS